MSDEMMATRLARSPVDPLLMLAMLACLSIGLVMVGSVSMAHEDAPFARLSRHGIGVLFALGMAAFVAAVPLHIWRTVHRPVLVLTVAAVVALMVPGLGRESHGATRWIAVGPISLQVTEFIKAGMVIFLAGHLARYREALVDDWRFLVAPVGTLAVLVVLLHFVRDFGTAVLLGTVTFSMLFLAGVRLRWFVGSVPIAAAAFSAVAWLDPTRLQRLTCFLDPWAEPFACGYQLTQALIAFGRGEWFGVGIGHSVQKLFYIPEVENDFLLAVVAEETGFVGVVLLLSLLALVGARMIRVGMRAAASGDDHGALLVYGAAVLLTAQAIISAGVNMGALPTKGLTMPLVSYGANSLMVCGVLVGLAVRCDWETNLREFERVVAPVERRGGNA